MKTTSTELVTQETLPSVAAGGMDAGTFALAMLSDDDFDERLVILKRGRDRMARIQRELMIDGEDFGLIPNTPKPTLYKSGAEKLAQIYRLAARLETSFTTGDNSQSPPLTYDAICFLHLGSFDGPVVASGHGTANSWEKRYRREGKKVCPKCGTESIIKSKAEYGGGFYCFPKAGGCGSRYKDDDESITSQSSSGTGEVVGQWDLGVTLLKMSEKRAFVDAVLRATASSGLFTQDLAEEAADDVSDRPFAPVVEKPAPVIGASSVSGVQRGGRTSNASSAQIAQVKAYSKSLKLGPHGLQEVLGLMGVTIALSEEPPVAAAELLEVLNSMDADQIGLLIQRLASLDEEADLPQ